MERVKEDSSVYEGDYLVWIETQIDALKQRRLGELDFIKLIDELEGFVRHQRRELRSRLQLIIMHLLKWQYQPRLRSASWSTTLATQRYALEMLLDDSPSLRHELDGYAQAEYARARRWAARETHLPVATFPDALPYTVGQLLDPDFVP